MASYQQLRHHSRAPYESPAKIFAKLKSKVQREMVDGVFDDESRPAELNGVVRTPKRRTSEDAVQHDMIFGHGEVTALTLSPIPSPQKNITCMPDDKRSHCVGTEQALKRPFAPLPRPFMESTAVCDLSTTRQSHRDGFHTNAWLADRLVHCKPVELEEAPRSVFSPTRLRKRKLDEQLLSKANNMLSDMDYVHCQEKGRKIGHGFSGDDHYTYTRMRHVDPAAMKRTGCAVDTTPRHPVTPAKIFAYLKEKENQRDQCDVQKVTSSTRPDAEWDHPSEVREEPECPVPRVTRLQSPDLDEDVRQDLVLTVPAQPVGLEDPLLLLSPQVSIPQKKQTVFKPKNWPKGITFPCENMIHLQKWFIRCSRTGLFLDGIRRDNNIPWNSNIITERVSSTVLKTITGRIYNLVGKMNLDAPSHFPKWFVKSFAHGFPSNWKDIYENYLSESKGLKRRSKTQSEKRSQKPGASNVQSLQQQQPKSRKSLESSPSSTTPSLQVSRSGRLIKPPLDYWRGGRVILDADMNVTIHDGYDTTIQAKVTPSITTVSTMLAKNTALVKVPVNNDCEQQESFPQSPLRRKVKAPQRKRHKTKANIIEKPPSPMNHSPTERATRSSLRQRAKERNRKEAEPQESMNIKKNKQKVSKAKPGKASQPPASSQPPADTSSSSQPLSRRQEKENILKKTGGKRTEKKSQMDLPRRSTRSSNSSLERGSHSQKSQNKRSKTNQTPQFKTPSPQPVQITTRTTAQSNRTRKRTAHNKQSSVLNDDAWTEEELRKLQEAVSCHPQHVTGYWTKVAVMVGTRSADECHKRYTCQWASKTPAKRESKAKPKAPSREKVDNPVISARVGTLRRKQQVRDFLEAMPKEDMDDVFSSAYMQNKRFEPHLHGNELETYPLPVKVPSMCPSDDHDFSMSDPEPLTPRHTGFPEAKTPQCLHITPNMMGSSSRNYDDKYVFQLQKRMKNRYQFNVQKHAPKNFSPTASVKKTMRRCANTENDTFVVWEMFPDKEAHSSEEEDFYFSEND